MTTAVLPATELQERLDELAAEYDVPGATVALLADDQVAVCARGSPPVWVSSCRTITVSATFWSESRSGGGWRRWRWTWWATSSGTAAWSPTWWPPTTTRRPMTTCVSTPPRPSDYMVPSAYVTLPALPMTTSGKLDRKALDAQAIGVPAAVPPAAVPPASNLRPW